ncbi:MAG: 50S ribosomal protein L25 [Verrucomicrobiales bacterium]
MSQAAVLQASKRARTGSSLLKQMRREGFVPAVMYGRAVEPVNLKVATKAITDMLRASETDNVLLTLEIEGGGKQMALIQDVQQDPLTSAIIHVDFHAVSQNEKIHAMVPVHLSGDAIGVKNGGLMDHQVHEIEVHCLPKDLPESLTLDVANIGIGEAAHVRDIPLPDGVEVSLDGDVVIAMVAQLRATGAVADSGEKEEGAAE